MDEKRISILVEPTKWERFKKLAKYKNSDASKEIRKFIDRYLSENAQLFLEMETKEDANRNR